MKLRGMLRQAVPSVVGLTLLVASAVSPGLGAAQAQGAPKTATVYLYQKPKNFNPLAAFNGPDQQLMELVFDNLVIINDQYQYEGRLAQSWDISDDAQTYTFHLRPGLLWSDGQPFSSSDVLFTYKLLSNTASGSAQAAKFDDVTGVTDYRNSVTDAPSGMTAPDANTFVIHLDHPNAAFLSTIAGPWFWILPQHVLGNDSLADLQNDPWFLRPTTGMGPFTFTDYQTDQFVQVDRNPNYRGPVGLDRIILKPVTSDVATAQLENGEMQLVQISPTDLDRIRSLPNVTVASAPGPGIILMGMSLDKPPLNDKRVRQAVMYAIDRKSIVDQVLAGQGTLTTTHILGPSWAIPSGLNNYDYDPNKAAQLLRDANWDPSQTLKIQWIPGQRDRDTTVQIIQSELAAVGMNIELNPVEVGPLLDNMKNRTFDFSLYGGGLYTVDPDSATVPLMCSQAYPAGGNNSHYCNQQVDQLFLQGRATADQSTRAAIYQQIDQILNDELPYITLYVPSAVWAYSNSLQGFKPHGDFVSGFWNAADWTLAQ